MTNVILSSFPTPDTLLQASETELERALLHQIALVCDDPARRMTTRDSVAVELFETGGYSYDFRKRSEIAKRIDRAWKALDDAGLIEEPDADNGKNGYRVISSKGKSASSEIEIQAAKNRSAFRRDMFHPALPDAAWNAFLAGDYDTAVLEAFKAIEAAVYQKGKYTGGEHGVALMMMAFNPAVGRIKAPDPSRAEARRNLFTGAFGELRNAKAPSGGPTITDPLVAVEGLMVAGALFRILDSAQ